MKKLFFFILLPITLIACEGRDIDQDNKDIQFLKRAGQNAMFLIGEPESVVDSILQKVGLKRIGQSSYLYNAPEELTYRLIPHFKEGNSIEIFNQIMIERKMYIEMTVYYHNQLCRNIDARSYISQEISHAGTYYLALSNSLYETCSSLDPVWQWHATIGGPSSPHDTTKGDYYDNKSRRAFESVVNKDIERGFNESGEGYIVKNDSSQIHLVYNIGWPNYSANATEFRQETGVEPYIEGFFDIGLY